MNQSNNRNIRVLAFDLYSRGFGFAVMENGSRLVDWGMKSTRNCSKAQILIKIEQLIKHTRPNRLVVEDVDHPSCRRRKRIREIIPEIFTNLEIRDLRIMKIPRENTVAILQRFGVSNKVEMARVIANQYPELDDILPPNRKSWMTEDPRINIFDSIVLIWSICELIDIDLIVP